MEETSKQDPNVKTLDPTKIKNVLDDMPKEDVLTNMLDYKMYARPASWIQATWP